jgi:aminopeptidase N
MAAAPAAAEAPPRPVEKLRADYAPVPYTINSVDLKFVLGTTDEETSTCEAALRMAPLGAAGAAARPPLFLDGRTDAKLLSIRVDGAEVPKEHYTVDARGVTLAPAAIPAAASWELRLVTELRPHENSSLEGLYKSGGNFCTQCEAEGFRGIVPFLDRPDVMAT